jgi:hypothetical protein
VRHQAGVSQQAPVALRKKKVELNRLPLWECIGRRLDRFEKFRRGKEFHG